MEYTEKQHVQVPHPSEWNLKALDWYIYAHIRKYMNKETYQCFPTMETIKSDTGCSLPTIRKAIKNLEREKAVKVIRQNKHPNTYEFGKLSQDFERITCKFLLKKDWTPETKGYIMNYLTQAYKDPSTQFAYVSKTQEELAKAMHTSVSTIKRKNQELKDLGIMVELTSYKRDEESGLQKTVTALNLEKIAQAILYVKKQVDENTDDIAALKEDNDTLKRDNAILKKQLAWAMQEIHNIKERTKSIEKSFKMQ